MSYIHIYFYKKTLFKISQYCFPHFSPCNDGTSLKSFTITVTEVFLSVIAVTELLNITATMLLTPGHTGQCKYSCERTLSQNLLIRYTYFVVEGQPYSFLHLCLQCRWETMQVRCSVTNTNRLMPIYEQNSTTNTVEVRNTSNPTLASSALDTNSVEAKSLGAVTTELQHVEF
jgi:hypothetical protein